LEARVPFVLEALKQFDVLASDDWTSALGAGLLQTAQAEQIRRTVYEELLSLAFDLLDGNAQRRNGLSAKAAASQALAYLAKAERSYRPTKAFYSLRARCGSALGDEATAQTDRQLADHTGATIAVDHILRGRAAFDAGQFPEAVQALEAALRLEPTNMWSLMWLGGCLCHLGELREGSGRFAEAVGIFSGCILKRPDHAHAYYWRSRAYAGLRRSVDALTDINMAIELDPKRADIWNHRGVIYYDHLAQFDKAIADYTKAVELDPKNEVYQHNRGFAYSKLGQWDKALTDYAKAIELNPNYAPAWNGRGMIDCDHFAQYDKALAEFSRAIEIDPKFFNAWRNRGVAYRKSGQMDNALVNYSKAAELEPNNSDVHNDLGLVLWYQGKLELALAEYRKALSLDPNLGTSLWNLSMLLANGPDPKLRDPNQAIELAKRGISLGGDAGWWQTLGWAYYRAGSWKDSIAALEKSVQLMPAGADAYQWLFLAMNHWRLGHQEEARRWYARADEWIDHNKEKLDQQKQQSGPMTDAFRLRVEAAELMGLKKM
jgi:tetratricopeptide (TPR) repeat protein